MPHSRPGHRSRHRSAPRVPDKPIATPGDAKLDGLLAKLASAKQHWPEQVASVQAEIDEHKEDKHKNKLASRPAWVLEQQYHPSLLDAQKKHEAAQARVQALDDKMDELRKHREEHYYIIGTEFGVF